MIIDVKQTASEQKNEFEIMFDNKKMYNAKLPFLMISGVFNLDKIKDIKIYDLNNKLKYISKYDYLDNQCEEFVPFKYLITKSQKFYQLKFINETENDEILIFFNLKEIWNEYFIIKYKDEYYNCYSVEEGYIRHICIFKDDKQVAELLKPNIIFDGKDTYRIYLKQEYDFLADAVAMLALYLDRTEYNSSYLKNKGVSVSKNFSYSKVNKYYDSNWVKDNFSSKEYFEEIDNMVLESKQKIKKQAKKLLTIMGIGWGIAIILTVIVLMILKIKGRL